MADETTKTLSGEDFESYLELRETIESFTMMATEFYGQGEDAEDRRARMQIIKTYVFEFTRDLFGATGQILGCPVGYHYNGSGRCVPDTRAIFVVAGSKPNYAIQHGPYYQDPCEEAPQTEKQAADQETESAD